MNKIHKIVLTGGPCGGKTTALSRLTERLEALGYVVMLVPETATYIVKNGSIHFPSLNMENVMKFEEVMLSVQISIEEHFEKLAEIHDKPIVMIHDRGTMDIAAYMEEEHWNCMLDDLKWNRVWLRDRYDAVIHLTTAADGAEDYYTLENNEARFESVEEARSIDKRIKKAWMGHPHLRVISNEGDFEWKLNQIEKAVCAVIGEPEPQEIERSFLIKIKDGDNIKELIDRSADEGCVVLDIDQTYLLNEDGLEARVRRRGQSGHSIYTYATKTKSTTKLKRMQKEHQVNGKEYLRLLESRDLTRKTIRKQRYCFLYCGKYFELDVFVDTGLMILEVELEHELDKFIVPNIFEVIVEVTEDSSYNNYNLSKIN